MVARQQIGPIWTVDQYLVLERYSTVKHEYHGGYVYALAGGSQAHSQIAGNVLTLLRAGVRGSGGRALNPDIKIRQSPDDYVYSDAVVACDPRDDVPGQDWIDYPTLVVEVLSPSTERHDQGSKFEGYKHISTFREYVLVEYRQRGVEVWRRDDAGGGTSQPTGRAPLSTCRNIRLSSAASKPGRRRVIWRKFPSYASHASSRS